MQAWKQSVGQQKSLWTPDGYAGAVSLSVPTAAQTAPSNSRSELSKRSRTSTPSWSWKTRCCASVLSAPASSPPRCNTPPRWDPRRGSSAPTRTASYPGLDHRHPLPGAHDASGSCSLAGRPPRLGRRRPHPGRVRTDRHSWPHRHRAHPCLRREPGRLADRFPLSQRDSPASSTARNTHSPPPFAVQASQSPAR